MMWIEISKINEYVQGREMFVVKGFAVNTLGPSWPAAFPYDTDPYCVWLEDLSVEGVRLNPRSFVRWPHHFMPTHFHLLPKELA